MVRFLHIADVHLECPFNKENPDTASLFRKETRDTFERAVNYAKENNIALIIIAGDLFDRFQVGSDRAGEIFSMMERSGIDFVISPGNHDPYTPGGVYSGKLPENVHVFKSENLSDELFVIGGEKVRVSGYAFTSASMSVPPFRNKKAPDDGYINILSAHGNILPSSIPDCPITKIDIEESGYDYIALGHIHNYPGIKKAGNTYYGYSGSLEPHSFDDLGDRGFYDITIEKKNGELKFNSSFIKAAKRRYSVIYADMTGISSNEEAEEKVNSLLSEIGKNDMIRLVFNGFRKKEVELPLFASKKLLKNAGRAEIKDETLPFIEDYSLMNDRSVIGCAKRELDEKMNSEDEKEREEALLAFKFILTSLYKSDLSALYDNTERIEGDLL